MLSAPLWGVGVMGLPLRGVSEEGGHKSVSERDGKRGGSWDCLCAGWVKKRVMEMMVWAFSSTSAAFTCSQCKLNAAEYASARGGHRGGS